MIFCKKTVIVLVIVLVVLFLLFSPLFSGEAYPAGNKYINNSLLNGNIREGEAYVWYLGHSGWAVKTKNHFLIFDYSPMGSIPAELSISNGHIEPFEMKYQNVFIFVSHAHGDHYDPEIWKLEKSIDSVTFIFGWQPEKNKSHNLHITEPRTKKYMDGMEILTIYHEFDGIPEVAYLVKVDGLVIFHAGDHGSTGEILNPLFKDNIDFLSKNSNGIDMAFISQFGSKGGGEVNKGDLYTIEQLKPKVTFPMHRGGGERVYKKFAQEAADKGAKTRFFCVERKGDRFFYQNNMKK
ncbi:MAG: MBL fold metallo-hydrolase [Candidatus Aminicenantes bacterium]|nr:MAG: MBL fold metallo-hydrolase [Candidatus Aminicenantes bacterium]